MSEPRVLGDRYELQDVIGRGGMAEVYRAHDRVLHRAVAVKLMSSLAGSESDRARFADEARMLARLNHPGLVTVLDAATSGQRPYLVMELVNGPSLAECCQGVALDPDRVAAIGVQLSEALAYAHGAGIVHRDLKPGNVLLADDDRVLLTDFGIARLLSEAARHTATGVTIGTAAYLAPEQVRGEDVTPAADVYSLGLVLLEALTGQRAYPGSPTEAALARLSTPPPVPDALPSSWQDLLRRMTSLSPGDRPDARQVAASLRELSSGLDAAAATAALRTDSGHTRPLTVPGTAQAYAGSPSAEPAGPAEPATGHTVHLRRRRRARAPELPRLPSLRWVAAGVAVLVLLLVAALALGGGSEGGSNVPADVPPRLEQPLQDLHDAVNGEG